MSDGNFVYAGALNGHRDWVTALATPQDNNDVFLSASRDGSILSWKRDPAPTADTQEVAVPTKRFEGHSGFVQDVTLSHDGEYALSGAWDHTVRLWSTKNGDCRAVFRGHTKDVLSVAFSPDNRQIVSGARDNQIKLWNLHGECKHTFTEGAHSDWVSCVRFSPRAEMPFIVSAGYDNLVKLWTVSPNFRLATNFEGHTGYVNTVAVSPDGSLCASGGKDGTTMLWDLSTGSHLYQLEAGEVIHSLTFSPNRYWLCAATESGVRIWDLESKKLIAELAPPRRKMGRKALVPECTSLAWSMDGNTLYTGFTDNSIHVFGVRDS
jgi:guanine nucleotide-binding protein subunit beta-2-like 1 protein